MDNRIGRPSGLSGATLAEPAAPVRRHRRAHGRLATVLSAALAVTVVTGGSAAAYTYAGEVPRGTVVLGVPVGGKSREEASSLLRAELVRRADLLSAPLTVRVGERTVQVRPADVDLTVDVEATLAAAAGTRPGPASLLFGSRTVEPVVTVDPARLDTALRGGTGGGTETMTMPAITYEGLLPRPTYPAPSRSLDPERSARSVREGWLTGRPVVVPLVTRYPATTADEVDRLLEELARPAVAAPVTVSTDRGDVTVPPAAIARSLVMTADATGRINPRVDGDKLREALGPALTRIEVPPVDVRISIVDGRPRSTPGADGLRVDTDALANDLMMVLPLPQGRQVKGSLVRAAPRTGAREVVALAVNERVSTFTTRFPGGPSAPRNRNIARIAGQVDGVLLRPGETFSVNGHVGPRTVARGYLEAPIYAAGGATGVGGGVSQFTATLFNAVLLAGLQDVEHRPHTNFSSVLPPVTDATLRYPEVDLKFRNDTPYGVLIDTSVTANAVTVSIWSTRVHDSVTIEYGDRRNVTAPGVVERSGASCEPSRGSEGFTQDAWRVFRTDGREVRRERFTWRYEPDPRVRCVGG